MICICICIGICGYVKITVGMYFSMTKYLNTIKDYEKTSS